VGLSISADDARRIALNAQGFGRPRPAKVDAGALRRVVERLGAVQIDAVNVLVRSHYLPGFSRLGAYPMDLFERLVARRQILEYHAHALSYVPIDLHPFLRWRMEINANNKHWVAFRQRIERDRPGYADAILKQIEARGPLAFTDLDDAGRRDRSELAKSKYAESTLLWWRGSDGKSVLEDLAAQGRVTVAGRRSFEPLYDLTERVLPAKVLATPTPTPEDAQRELVRRAMRGLGVAMAKDVADYFRLPAASTKARLQELVDAGELSQVDVEGWPQSGFLDASASAKPVEARALLSPFDSVTWERARNERIFGFKHSFEIYVPAAKRVYGYFVLPFLLDDRLVGRVDLKADRAAGVLRVFAAFHEPGVDRKAVAEAMRPELDLMAEWLGLSGVDLGKKGNLTSIL
jgi:uncharacterized protein